MKRRANMSTRTRTRKITNLRTHPDSYVTTADLANYWRVSRKQVYKQIEAGLLAAIRLGPRLLRIQTSEAIRFEDLAVLFPAEPPPAEPPARRKKKS
jgi:excisionase family DNA binding protein